MTAKTVIDVILGEAKAGSYEDMLAIASVIENRAKQLGVTPEQVVSVQSEFNAYGKQLPSGVSKYKDLAERALQEVKTKGPVHDATFYATSKAKKGLPSGLSKVASTDGHEFFTDPQNRSIKTSAGYKQPSKPEGLFSYAADGPMPPSAAPRNGQEAINAALNVPNLRNRARTVQTQNQEPLAQLPALDSLFDYPLGAKPERVAEGFAYGPENYDNSNLDPETAYAARRAFDNLGIDPRINSGFRSGVVPENAKRDYNKAVGGATHSQHKLGKALDISTRGMTDAQKAAMVDALMAEGLGGIGVGANIIHADSAAPRSWTYGNSVPEAVRSVMEARYEGGRLNRYPSDYGNIPAPDAKPAPAPQEVITASASGSPGTIAAQNASTGADLGGLFSEPELSQPSRVSSVEAVSADPVNSSSAVSIPPVENIAPVSQSSLFAAVEPTQVEGLRLFDPIDPVQSTYSPPASQDIFSVDPVNATSPAQRTEAAFSLFGPEESVVAANNIQTLEPETYVPVDQVPGVQVVPPAQKAPETAPLPALEPPVTVPQRRVASAPQREAIKTVQDAVPSVAETVEKYGGPTNPGDGWSYGYSPFGSGVARVHDSADEQTKIAASGPGIFGAFKRDTGIDLEPAAKAALFGGAGLVAGPALGTAALMGTGSLTAAALAASGGPAASKFAGSRWGPELFGDPFAKEYRQENPRPSFVQDAARSALPFGGLFGGGNSEPQGGGLFGGIGDFFGGIFGNGSASRSDYDPLDNPGGLI